MFKTLKNLYGKRAPDTDDASVSKLPKHCSTRLKGLEDGLSECNRKLQTYQQTMDDALRDNLKLENECKSYQKQFRDSLDRMNQSSLDDLMAVVDNKVQSFLRNLLDAEIPLTDFIQTHPWLGLDVSSFEKDRATLQHLKARYLLQTIAREEDERTFHNSVKRMDNIPADHGLIHARRLSRQLQKFLEEQSKTKQIMEQAMDTALYKNFVYVTNVLAQFEISYRQYLLPTLQTMRNCNTALKTIADDLTGGDLETIVE